MADPKSVKEKLEAAIADEKSAQRKATQIYEQLTEKMNAYQMGCGPAPTAEEFALWRAAVELRIKTAELAIHVDGEL